MKNNIERGFNKLAKEQSTNPPEFVWDNIEETLHPKPSRKFVIILFFGLISGAILVGLLGYNWDDKGLEDSQLVVSTDIIKSKSPLSKNETPKEKAYPNSDQNFSQSINLDDNIQPQLKTKKKVTANTYAKKSNESEVTKEINSSQSDLSNILNSTNKSDYSIPSNNDINSFKLQLDKVFLLPALVLEPNHISMYEIKDEVVCPSFSSSKKVNVFATLGILGGTHNKSIGNGQNSILAAKRNQSESSWYSYGINASVGINFSPQLYAGIGIDWTQSKDKFYNESEAITKMIITFDPSNGEPVDTSFVTGKLVNKGEIRYNSLDIPLFVGFHRQINTWAFGVEVGALFNLSFKTSGKIYNEALSISKIEDEPAIYKNSLNLGLKTAFVVRKSLRDGLSVELKPTFKTYINNINDSAYALPMKLSVFGLNLGLRKDF